MTTASRLPTGTVTFLFTDIEGSTRTWERCPDAMREALAAHDALFREIVPARRGAIFKTVGDAICAAFERAEDALLAAVDAQRRLTAHAWPAETGEIRVRMGLHTGTAQERDDDYFGRTVNRVARLMSIAHGGQILVSGTTARLLRASDLREFELRDLGSHRLKDLAEPEPTFQVIADGLRIDFPALASLDAHPNNLPSQTSTFVGRSQELSALLAALERNRLITITGPGGIGKTRLSQQLGADGIDQFKDGVWFMELAALTESALLAGTISDVLHVREIPQEPVLETLLHTLSRKKALLILDNCEHLLTDVAAFAKEVLARSPTVSIVATSREPLHVAVEHVYPLLPLPVHDSAEATSDAVTLFIDRARSARETLELTAADLLTASQICERLDGIPLAIELAAARVGTLSLSELNIRLSRRFQVLVSRDATLSARHRTLRQTVDWSYQLLDPEEQAFAAELAIFPSSFTLNACEAILPHGDATLDLLESMVTKSIVRLQPGEDHHRYVHYELVREYLADKLQDSAFLRLKHFSYFSTLAAPPERATPESQGAWMLRLHAELSNVRAALEWSQLHRPNDFAGTLLNLSRYWDMSNQYAEGLRWLRAGLGIPELPARLRAGLLARAALFAAVCLDHEAARSQAEACLDAYSALGDDAGAGQALLHLGQIKHRMGDEAGAAENYWLALEKLRSGGNRRGEAIVQINLTLLAFSQQDFAAAETLLARASALADELGDPNVAAYVTGLRASLAYRRGNLDEAIAINRDALAMRRLLANPSGVAEALDRMVAIHLARAEFGEARVMAAESMAIAIQNDSPPLLVDAFEAFAEVALAQARTTEAARCFASAQFLRRQHTYHHVGLRNTARIETDLRRVAEAVLEAELGDLENAGSPRWEQLGAELAAEAAGNSQAAS